MDVLFFAPRWGSESLPPDTFLRKAKASGYDGVEMNLPLDEAERDRWLSLLERHGLKLIVQQWETVSAAGFDEQRAALEAILRNGIAARPMFINSQTGKDYFSFEDNCSLIDLANDLARESGVAVLHEIHRGKFSYHPAALGRYLDEYPDLALTADLAHWCCVCESYLEAQESALQAALERVRHIHARVGFPEGPQVADFRAPEWGEALGHRLRWWDAVIARHRAAGAERITITPEFGPPPCMPALAYTRTPVADQWELNAAMMGLLRERYATKHVTLERTD